MNNIRLTFEHPLMLLLLIPALILAFIPFLKLSKHRRHSNNRILSLGLHSVILCLIAFVMAGFRVEVEDVIVTKDILFLVDKSYSQNLNDDEVDNYLKKVLTNYDNNYRIGIINFGSDFDYVAKLSNNVDDVLLTYLNSTSSNTDDSGTNFKKALYFAKSLFKNPKNGRIIILSDGLQTDEDGLLACKNLSGDGVIVDCVYFENQKWASDVMIESLTFEKTPALNEANTLQIKIKSFNIQNTTLNVVINNQNYYEKEVAILQENNLIEVPISFEKTNFYEIKVSISSPTDQFASNNCYYTFVNIEGVKPFLLVEGSEMGSVDIKNLLTNFSYESEITTPANLNNYTLEDYGQIILINVDYNDLPAGFDESLDTYLKAGGNLLTTGGKNTYNLGHMQNTLFDEFMPINFVAPDYKPQVFMFVIDNSSSMLETITGSAKTKMDLAKEATITAIEELHSYDYVGIITFSKDAKLVCELMPVSKKTEIITKIEGITTEVGTAYLPAFKMASENLLTFNEVENKNIIFISDGNPQDEQYKAYIASMFAKNITTSAIALGDNINESEMQELASIGGGKYYHVNQASQLVAIMLEATTSFNTDDFIEEAGVPIIKRYGSLLSGIRTLPELSGYNRVSAKVNSETYLTIDDNPVYTTWDYYLGKVGCFMGDLSKEAAPLYFEDEQGLLLIRNIVTSLSSEAANQKEMSVTITADNYSQIVEIKTTTSKGLKELTGQLTFPNNSSVNLTFYLTSSNTFTATLTDCFIPGIYTLEITKTASGKKVTQTEYFAFSYSEEYQYFSGGLDFLNEITKLSKHSKLYTLDEELFTNEIEFDVIIYNPQILFLTIALMLFLFDIVLRKFKFNLTKKKNL